MSRLLLVALGCLILTGCASTGAVPRPFPMPGGAATPIPSGGVDPSAPGAAKPADVLPGKGGGADGYSISSTALSLRGAPYRNGGTDPQRGFDCSGLVSYVFAQHGVALPRDVRHQYQVGDVVETSSLAPGDLVFFTTVAPGASHVGIVIGGDQFVHAPSSNGVVRVENLGTPYWSKRFIGARRAY